MKKSVELIPANRNVDLELLTFIKYVKEENKNVVIPDEFNQKISINVREFSFNDLCVLPENRLLASDYYNECLSLYDENMKFIKKFKVPLYEKNNFKPDGIATNGKDRIYISEDTKGILMTDLDFNLCLRSNQVKNPHGLCFSDNVLYVCCFDEMRICTFKSDLTYMASFQLDFQPWYIQVVDKIACIRHRSEKISFYTLPEFTLKYRYDGHNGFICIVNSKFYEFDQITSTFYCYNSDGTIRDKKVVSGPCKLITIFDPICYFGGKFVLVSSLPEAFIFHNNE